METETFPQAASNGNVDLVKRLIASGDNVNATDSNGATSLLLAISSEKGIDVVSQITRALLQAGASLDAQNHKGYAPLHVAAMIGHVDFVDQFIRAGADVDAEVGSNGATSLFLAIRSDRADNDRTEVIRLLVEAGASLEKQNAYGFSPLRKAVALGKVNAVRQLILGGADVNEVNNERKSILLSSIRSRRNADDAFQISQMLLEAGASPDISDRRGITPLHAAVTLNKVRQVDQLIKAGANVNAIDRSEHRTILHFVISRIKSDEGSLEILQLLLKAGAPLSAYNRKSCDALHFAADLRKVKIVEQLILAGANVDSTHPESDESCLHKIAKAESIDDSALAIMHLLLNAGATIDSRDRKQRTPLHNAAKTGNERMIKQLIEAGANVHAEDSYNQSVLSVAVSSRAGCHDCLGTVCILLHAGASVESSKIHTRPLLHVVVANDCLEIVELLISAGADLHAVNEDGNTCLHAAAYYAKKYSAILQILLDAGAPLNQCNEEGQTPLHVAVSQSYVEGVKSLTKAGADANAEDELGKTSLHLAIELENPDRRLEIIRSLLQAGASVVKRDFSDMTPLHTAVMSGKLQTIELKELLQAYAIEYPNSDISKDLESICGIEGGNYDHLQVIRLLLKVDVLLDKQLTPLHYAVSAGDVALAKWIIRDGVDVNAVDKNGMTCLHCMSHSPSFLKMIPRGSRNGYSLSLWKHHHFHEIVELLLNAGAKTDACDKNGETPLVHAVNAGDPLFVEQLIDAGADVNAITKEGCTILVSLCKSQRCGVEEEFIYRTVSLLVAAGAEIISNGDRNSPRHLDHVLTEKPFGVYHWYAIHQKEVELMRESFIHAPITYYQILRRRGELSYFRNKSVIDEFERRDFAELFPIFRKDLVKSFRATQFKRGLMDQASNGLYNILGFSHGHIHDRILDHLKDRDLVNLRYV